MILCNANTEPCLAKKLRYFYTESKLKWHIPVNNFKFTIQVERFGLRPILRIQQVNIALKLKTIFTKAPQGVNTNSKTAKAVRLTVIIGASAAATISAPAFSAKQDSTENVGRIHVTGSRIKGAEM